MDRHLDKLIRKFNEESLIKKLDRRSYLQGASKIAGV
jgi:alkaline phosphatase D